MAKASVTARQDSEWIKVVCGTVCALRASVFACCAVLLLLSTAACSLIHPLPDLHFKMDPAMPDYQVDIVSMSSGSRPWHEGEGVSASVATGVTSIRFLVNGDGQESEFDAEVHVERSIKGASWRIARLSDFNGSMWLAEQNRQSFVFSGSHALEDSFLLGFTETSIIGLNDGMGTVIRALEPGATSMVGEKTWGIVCKGEKGASLFVMLEHRAGPLEMCGPQDSLVRVSQGAESREFRFDQLGRSDMQWEGEDLKIKWFPAGEHQAAIDVVIDRPLEWHKCILTFSSRE